MEGSQGIILLSDMTLGLLIFAVALYPHWEVWAEGPPTSEVF